MITIYCSNIYVFSSFRPLQSRLNVEALAREFPETWGTKVGFKKLAHENRMIVLSLVLTQ